MTEDERIIAQWYSIGTERDRCKLIGDIPGSKEYGLCRSYHRLPEAAKERVRKAFFVDTEAL